MQIDGLGLWDKFCCPFVFIAFAAQGIGGFVHESKSLSDGQTYGTQAEDLINWQIPLPCEPTRECFAEVHRHLGDQVNANGDDNDDTNNKNSISPMYDWLHCGLYLVLAPWHVKSTYSQVRFKLKLNENWVNIKLTLS